ncbi:MAG: type II toxin-antitoxin system RelE/ParE family toxin [Saprospiraceae bacterium]|nr:type II toxin-antitoxin system RelE/ParE family toxin [Saprospiraceae bacterium]
MRLNYILSPLAQEDLENIWIYTATIWDIDQAEKYFDLLMDGITVIREEILIGRSIEYVKAGYRSFVCESHLIIYRIDKDFIDIVRILNQRMDVYDKLK